MTKRMLLSIDVPDVRGSVAAAIAPLGVAGVNILAVLGWAAEGIVELEVDRPEAAMAALDRQGIGYRQQAAETVELEDRPGVLHDFLTELAGKGVDLRSLCASGSLGGSAGGRVTRLVWTSEA